MKSILGGCGVNTVVLVVLVVVLYCSRMFQHLALISLQTEARNYSDFSISHILPRREIRDDRLVIQQI